MRVEFLSLCTVGDRSYSPEDVADVPDDRGKVLIDNKDAKEAQSPRPGKAEADNPKPKRKGRPPKKEKEAT